MEPKDIEQFLENAKYSHLSDATLVSYRDGQLNETGLAMADAHLNLCLVCERRLTFLKEEQEALGNYAVTSTDRALIQESIESEIASEAIVSDEYEHVISVEVPNTDDLNQLVGLLASGGLSPTVFQPRMLSGRVDFITVVLPVSVGAVQAIAEFLSSFVPARRDLKIFIDDVVIDPGNLTPDHVEEIIGKELSPGQIKKKDD